MTATDLADPTRQRLRRRRRHRRPARRRRPLAPCRSPPREHLNVDAKGGPRSTPTCASPSAGSTSRARSPSPSRMRSVCGSGRCASRAHRHGQRRGVRGSAAGVRERIRPRGPHPRRHDRRGVGARRRGVGARPVQGRDGRLTPASGRRMVEPPRRGRWACPQAATNTRASVRRMASQSHSNLMSHPGATTAPQHRSGEEVVTRHLPRAGYRGRPWTRGSQESVHGSIGSRHGRRRSPG